MNKLIWLRVSYWAGAVADVLIGVLTLIPSRMGETEFRYPMGLAAVLLFCWAALLAWADRDPAERKGVLALTIVVIVGLVGTGLHSAATGIFSWPRIVPTSLLGVLLITLFAFSYLNARNTKVE